MYNLFWIEPNSGKWEIYEANVSLAKAMAMCYVFPYLRKEKVK